MIAWTICEQLSNEYVSPELRNLAILPQPIITKYKRMWAYGNHFRAEDPIRGNTYLTYDSGIACVAATECQSSAADRRPVEAKLKYVWVLRNIIQVNYVYLKINVMVCSSIKPNVAGNPTIKQDDHGFWLIRKGAYQGPREEPYLLPVHASQVNPALNVSDSLIYILFIDFIRSLSLEHGKLTCDNFIL